MRRLLAGANSHRSCENLDSMFICAYKTVAAAYCIIVRPCKRDNNKPNYNYRRCVHGKWCQWFMRHHVAAAATLMMMESSWVKERARWSSATMYQHRRPTITTALRRLHLEHHQLNSSASAQEHSATTKVGYVLLHCRHVPIRNFIVNPSSALTLLVGSSDL